MPDRTLPWSANPDNKGNAWIPYFGAQNRIARLDIDSAAVRSSKCRSRWRRGVHSTFPAPDGSVWFADKERTGWESGTGYEANQRVRRFGGTSEVTVSRNAQGDVWAAAQWPAGHQDRQVHALCGSPFSYSLALDKEGTLFPYWPTAEASARVDREPTK